MAEENRHEAFRLKDFLTQTAGVMETDPEVAKDHQEAFRLYKEWRYDDKSGCSESELNEKVKLKDAALAYLKQLPGSMKPLETFIPAEVKHMVQRVEEASSDVYVWASLECLVGILPHVTAPS